MNRLLALMALAIPVSALARSPAHVDDVLDLYYLPYANLEVRVPGAISNDTEGDGFGLRVRAPLSEFLRVSGEYRRITYDATDLEPEDLRAGIELRHGRRGGALLEYVSLRAPALRIRGEGFGAHWRLRSAPAPRWNVFGQLGYLGLRNDYGGGHLTGGELSLGCSLSMTPHVGGFAEFQYLTLEDETDTEYVFSHLRLGLRLGF